MPPLAKYDGLDLTENGVGLVRPFLDQRETAVEELWGGGGRRVTLVTGTLFAPVLAQATAHLPEAEVVPVDNRFFGPTVTVAGLLVGQDVLAALQEQGAHELVVLPAAMFGGPEGQTLDGMRPDDVQRALGRPVLVAPVSSAWVGAPCAGSPDCTWNGRSRDRTSYCTGDAGHSRRTRATGTRQRNAGRAARYVGQLRAAGVHRSSSPR